MPAVPADRVVPLPPDPSWEQLRKLAKDLRDEKRADDPAYSLSRAQLAIAQRHGFASCPRLKQHVALVNALTRAPDEDMNEDDLLRNACLVYGPDDGPHRWARAREILIGDPAQGEASAGHLLDRPAPTPLDEMIAALLNGDPIDRDSPLLALAKQTRPGLIVWAVARGQTDGVPRLVDLGFDVNRRARGDMPYEDEWETALHIAVDKDDPDARDTRFDATPLDWARHLGRPAMVALLDTDRAL